MVRTHFCPRPRTVLKIGVASAATLLLVQCDRLEPEASSPANQPIIEEPQSASPPPASTSSTTLRRGAILNAAAQAASAHGRQQLQSGPDPLVGRLFSVIMPFGCHGPASVEEGRSDTGVPSWTWGPDRETILIRVAPQDWLGSGLLARKDGTAAVEDWEAAEGFWVPKPWTDAETCPSKRSADPSVDLTHSPQTVGLVAIYEAGASRIGRRNGRAYVVTLRRQGDEPLQAPVDGFRLRLEGRVVGFPGGSAFRCNAAGPNIRPVCIAAVQLDQVRIEDASGAPLSEWRAG